VNENPTAMGPARVIRVIARCWTINMKSLTTSSFFILITILQPIIFASIAFFMFKAGGRAPTLLYAALGAGLMGIWSATLFGSGGIIQWERWQGTLELLVAAPVPFLLVLIPATIATSSLGVYAIGATLLWGKVFFNIPLQIEHPLAFVIAIPVTVLGLGLLGLVLASTFILYRNANALSNLLEYPVWLATGLLVPLSLLPGWVSPIAYVLAPTWGIRAIREAALGGDPMFAIAMTVLLGVGYLLIGAVTIAHFERAARERAALALA
jgi:ABC-2 type transport system permease protein